MEVILKSNEIDISDNRNIEDKILSTNTDFQSDISNIDYIKTSLSNESFNQSFEDSNAFLSDFFKGKNEILNEKWDNTITIQGKISHLTDEEIFVDCLVDSDERLFDHRAFPILLFKNLTKIECNKPVLIKTSIKPGSIRIDIYPGEGIVDLNIFEIKEKWDTLINSGLDDKLISW